ncbi:hypothetical protein V0288_25000 [Pannus brasiliensis CCIBt3594]|uniref:DUF4900 domain-containing protein n=1 Tax=Pannus brasiliensis CCIBt3594 TaxID=1427578 RepID=A0AAW9R236_9CHRO
MKNNRGFALTLALMFGVIFTGLALAMIARSRAEQSQSVIRRSTARGLGIAEVALARVQDLLDNNRLLAIYSMSYWASLDPTATTDSAKTAFQLELETRIDQELKDICGSTLSYSERATIIRSRLSTIKSIGSSEWQTLPDGQGSYRLVAYYYPGTPGVITARRESFLVVEGRTDRDNAESTSRVEVNLPIIPQPNDSLFTGTQIPGLWLDRGATNDGNQSISTDGSYTGGASFNSSVAMSDRCSYTPTQQAAIANFVTSDRIAPVSGTAGHTARFVREGFPDLPPIPTGLPAAQTNLALTNSETFPRSGDVATAKTTMGGQSVSVYEYIVDRVNLTGNNTIAITPGQRVIFYLRGNIGGTGSAGIRHDCSTAPAGTNCTPTNFQIFAYNTVNSTSPEICLRGTPRLDAFIFAPAYAIGKTGLGDFYGSIWGDSWGKISNCGSRNPSISIIQQGDWTNLYNNFRPLPRLPRIDSITTWNQAATDSTPVIPPGTVLTPP